VTGETLRIEALTKVFGRRRRITAVGDLTFTVQPGRVTGFLGPNGSGKTTTLRCLLGLVTPTEGQALIGDQPYRRLVDPTTRIGGALEASGFHPGRSGRNHLRVVAAATAVPDSRVDELLEVVGLQDAARRRVVEYSLGMRQRLALATALVGDPGVLVLDEPANGLDPEGIAWLRTFLREHAAQGGTVLVSSHVLSEVQQTVDDVVIINNGSLVHAGPLAALGDAGSAMVVVRSPDADRLHDALVAGPGDAVVLRQPDGALSITGMSAAEVGHRAFTNACELHELTTRSEDLEKVFLQLTGGAT
jgi:ABC-2 type transport system ATP-binding protein